MAISEALVVQISRKHPKTHVSHRPFDVRGHARVHVRRNLSTGRLSTLLNRVQQLPASSKLALGIGFHKVFSYALAMFDPSKTCSKWRCLLTAAPRGSFLPQKPTHKGVSGLQKHARGKHMAKILCLGLARQAAVTGCTAQHGKRPRRTRKITYSTGYVSDTT